MRVNEVKTKAGISLNKESKLVVLSLIIVVVFGIYILKLFSMQVLEGEVYREQSENLSSRVKTIPAQRGEIYDRNATVPMVVNTDSFAVDLIPGEIPSGDYDTVAFKLAAILGIGKNTIDEKIPSNMRRSFTAVEIKSGVPFSIISDIAENITDLPGVSWRSKPLRNYVQTGSFSHILGYVGDITKEELKIMYNEGYSNTSIVGKTGI